MNRDADILPSAGAAELIDFTCVSPWERLALDIELELRAWGLHEGQMPRVDQPAVGNRNFTSSCSSTLEPRPISCSPLSIADKSLQMELRSNEPNNTMDAHPLERLLGVNQCVLLAADTPDGIAANDGSDAAVLLSAMAVAASACSCSLPVIVPVGRPSSLRFIGRQMYPQHLRFSCDFTHQISEDQTHLAGLLHLFQNKRTAARRLSPPAMSDAHIKAKFVYDWIDFSFKLAPSPGSFASDRRLNAVQSVAIHEADPVLRIRVTALWEEFPATSLKQNPILAGMPASTAARLRLSPYGDLLDAIASSRIPSARLPLTTPALSNLRLAQAASMSTAPNDPAAPLAVISVRKCRPSRASSVSQETSPRGSRSRITADHQSPRIARGPTSSALDEYLTQVGEYVAAAAIHDDRIDEQYLTSAVAALFEMDLGRGIMADVVDALGPNAAESTVLERLARLMGASETLNGAQKLWNLFLDGIEVHWEQDWVVCGVPFSAANGPDHDESLVTQKLQMINCCTERRRRTATGFSLSSTDLTGDSLGRKTRLDGVYLVEKEGVDVPSGEDTAVWEPHVQPHPLLTRDMLEEELKRMVLRAESNGGSCDLEAKRQSVTLKSDMMAFKGANPFASMADFVRWFSPSDWVPDEDDKGEQNAQEFAPDSSEVAEQPGLKSTGKATESQQIGEEPVAGAESQAPPAHREKGHLSIRMSRKGNFWEQLWQDAEQLPASEQAPLFDASAHGSKALADLRAMPMTQVLLHLATIQGSFAVSLLNHAFARPPALPSVHARIDHARHAMRYISSSLSLSPTAVTELGRIASALDDVSSAEHTALIATSVYTKLPPVDGLAPVVDQFACGQVAEVVDERERALVTRMAGLDDAGWRSVLLPEFREFVLRGGEEGGGGSDRMYARLGREEFRVACRLGLDYSV